MAVSITERIPRESTTYGGLIDAIGGVATVVLAIVGLAGTRPDIMVAIATIVFGVALLIEGGAILSDYSRIMFPPEGGAGSIEQFGASSLSSVFLAGAAGIVLGVLALLGIQAHILSAAAAVVFGCALMLSANSVRNLQMLKRANVAAGQTETSGGEILAQEMASGTVGMQTLVGVSAIVLGVLALAGNNPAVLTLVALLILGAALIMTGSTLSWTMLSFMARPSTQERASPTRSAER